MKTAHSPEILWERHKSGQPASEQDARPRKPGLMKPGTIWQSLAGPGGNPQRVWNSESVAREPVRGRFTAGRQGSRLLVKGRFC